MHILVDEGCTAWKHAPLKRRLPNVMVLDIGSTIGTDEGCRLASSSVIILGLRDKLACPSELLVKRIRDRLPHIPVFVCVEPGEKFGLYLPAFAWAGADSVFVLGAASEWSMLEDTLSRRLENPSPEIPLRALASRLPTSPGLTILLWGLRSGYRPTSRQVAREMFEMDMKTINKRLGEIGVPELSTVFRFATLLHAAEHERRGIKSVSRVASLLGLGGAKSLWGRRRTLARRLSTIGNDSPLALGEFHSMIVGSHSSHRP